MIHIMMCLPVDFDILFLEVVNGFSSCCPWQSGRNDISCLVIVNLMTFCICCPDHCSLLIGHGLATVLMAFSVYCPDYCSVFVGHGLATVLMAFCVYCPDYCSLLIGHSRACIGMLKCVFSACFYVFFVSQSRAICLLSEGSLFSDLCSSNR